MGDVVVKEYIGRKGKRKVIIDGENITIFEKDNIKETFTFSDITDLGWNKPGISGVGILYITLKTEKHSISFVSDDLELFMELCDILSNKSGCKFQLVTTGSIFLGLITGFIAIAGIVYFYLFL